MSTKIVSQDLKCILDQLDVNSRTKSWTISHINGEYTLILKLHKPVVKNVTRDSHVIPGYPSLTIWNSSHTQKIQKNRKRKSPSTRRRDKARLEAWRAKWQEKLNPSKENTDVENSPTWLSLGTPTITTIVWQVGPLHVHPLCELCTHIFSDS